LTPDKFCSSPVNIVTKLLDIIDICCAPPGVLAKAGEANSIHVFKFTIKEFNKLTVLLPNNKGSVAFLEPNLIEGALTTKLDLVSKLNPLTALNPIVWAELNRI
jgi:hypothetical protein